MDTGLTLNHFLAVSGILFAIGLAGVLIRRNVIVIFMCLELMLSAANLTLVAFSRFTGTAEEHGGLGSKVIVLKALGGDPKRPFFAVLTQGFPRLVTVTEAALAAQDRDADVPEGVLAQVRLNEDDALVPDLAMLEQRIGEALAEAA